MRLNVCLSPPLRVDVRPRHARREPLLAPIGQTPGVNESLLREVVTIFPPPHRIRGVLLTIFWLAKGRAANPNDTLPGRRQPSGGALSVYE
jgi:hypothetical protein